MRTAGQKHGFHRQGRGIPNFKQTHPGQIVVYSRLFADKCRLLIPATFPVLRKSSPAPPHTEGGSRKEGLQHCPSPKNPQTKENPRLYEAGSPRAPQLCQARNAQHGHSRRQRYGHPLTSGSDEFLDECFQLILVLYPHKLIHNVSVLHGQHGWHC